MFLAADAKINERTARIAGVLFRDPMSISTHREINVDLSGIKAEHTKDQQELSCIITLLEMIPTSPKVIILNGCTDPEMGQHLFDLLSQEIPVIEVSSFPGIGDPVYRGENTKPLFVTATGIDSKSASGIIEKMHGKHRIPTLLKHVDVLIREEMRP